MMNAIFHLHQGQLSDTSRKAGARMQQGDNGGLLPPPPPVPPEAHLPVFNAKTEAPPGFNPPSVP